MKAVTVFLLNLLVLPCCLLLFHMGDKDHQNPAPTNNNNILHSTFYDDSCQNPCWLGIEVGVSDKQFVETTLKTYGISYSMNGPFTYNISLKGRPSLPWKDVAHPAADIHLSGEIVSLMTFTVDLCPSTILATYGEPQIVAEGSTFLLLYPEYGLNFLLSADTQRVDGTILYPLGYIDQHFSPERQNWTDITNLLSNKCSDNLTQN